MKKKTVKHEEKEQVYYVGLTDPIEIRRSILESSKDIVQYLQRAEKFKAIRTEKAHEIEKLKETLRDVAKMVRRLRTDLPKTHLRTPLHGHETAVRKEELKKEIKKLKEIEPAPKAKKASAEPKRPMTELEKLESELGEIESRLTTLS